ncbi:PEP-CTERM sorting domain-containing protein [Nitrosomonas sp. Is24]|uniref:beta strand repeat-containing protein n=1 Tax=Nitrosomonas sp. Is24 TaxID=3080533 RepID=UPI00294B4D5B|nr:PEP-CTERM sorting domain-containing protein [Nitrosomonas sp. Is24]MDV6340997.1 PEP-CTERM sorting domain-containing protein [Nitrosomonas sp. Is24]
MHKQPFVLIFAVSFVSAGFVNQAVHADTKTWSSSDGFWHDDSSWSPSGVPGSGDDVIVSPYGGVDTILNFSSATGNRSANSLLISSETANTISFLQAGGSLTVSSQIVGSGFDSGSSGHGSYVLSGGSLSAEEEVIGDSYTLIPDVYGVFTQSGGTNTVTNLIISRAGSRGEYNLSGGSLLVDNEVIGIGYDVYSFGTNGIFTQSGGMHVVNGGLSIGERGFGTYTLSAGSLSANSESIGSAIAPWESGSGNFTQNGGKHTVSDTLSIGYGPNGRGSYILNEGSLSTNSESIGSTIYSNPMEGATGIFTQSGGTHTVSDILSIGLGGFGTYTLNAGSLSTKSESIGSTFYRDPMVVGGTGIFTQSGGTHTVSGILSIGIGEASTGKYDLNAGSLSAGSEHIYSGTFNQTGGTNTVNRLTLGLVGSSGIYNLSAGSLLADIEFIGQGDGSHYLPDGHGDLTQSGGMHTVRGELFIGYDGGVGTYNLSAGDLLADSEFVGSGRYFDNIGSGYFTQSGGTHTVIHDFIVGNYFGSASYYLSAGSLSVSSEFIGGGVFSSGTFIQSGGTNTVSDILSIGSGVESTGKYDLNAGSLSVGSEFIGGGPCCSASTGTFNQTGGVHTIAGLMTNNGVYNHSGGAFVVGAIDNSGTITQTGGTMTVNGNVTNTASGKIEIANSPAIFTGDVVNNGQFKTTHTTVTFSGTYTENGSYISDPSINNFTNIIIGTSGYLVGGTGDEWHITGSFENHSLQNTLWNTANAGLFFDGSGLKSLYLAGIDEGASPFGFTNNFAFGSLFLAQGAELNILDGNATPGAAMYVEQFNLAGGVSQLSSIHSDYNIYYNPALAGNAYLLGKTYALDGGGLLMAAVPEPETYAMLLAGLSVLGFAIRRREQNRKRLNRFD